MSSNTSVTPLGDSLRGLADILDRAPLIVDAVKLPFIPSVLDIVIDSPVDVWEIGLLLGLRVHSSVAESGGLHTTLIVRSGFVTARIFSILSAEEVGS